MAFSRKIPLFSSVCSLYALFFVEASSWVMVILSGVPFQMTLGFLFTLETLELHISSQQIVLEVCFQCMSLFLCFYDSEPHCLSHLDFLNGSQILVHHVLSPSNHKTSTLSNFLKAFSMVLNWGEYSLYLFSKERFGLQFKIEGVGKLLQFLYPMVFDFNLFFFYYMSVGIGWRVPIPLWGHLFYKSGIGLWNIGEMVPIIFFLAFMFSPEIEIKESHFATCLHMYPWS